MSPLNVALLFAAMTAVTYIPRALPALFMGKLKFGPRVEKFLKLIPYTAMAALIFPGGLTADEGHLVIGLVGGGVAALLAWRKFPVMVCVLGAIAADFLLYALAIPLP